MSLLLIWMEMEILMCYQRQRMMILLLGMRTMVQNISLLILYQQQLVELDQCMQLI